MGATIYGVQQQLFFSISKFLSNKGYEDYNNFEAVFKLKTDNYKTIIEFTDYLFI